MKNTLFLIIATFACCATGADLRTWTSSNGQTLEAELVQQQGTTVVLKDASGKIKRVPLGNFSAGDMQYLRAVQTGKAVPGGGGGGGPLKPGLEALIGTGKLVDPEGNTVDPTMLSGKKIGIYFSASWCGPCRSFTPKLAKAYEDMQKDGKPFEIILASFDRDDSAAEKYHKKMPWLMAELGSKTEKSLKGLKKSRGIPEFIVIDDEGNLLSANGRSDISSKGADAFDSW